MDKKNLLGELHCKICGQSFQTAIHSLSQPVDIYSDWIDACEDLAEEADKQGGAPEDEKEMYSDDEYDSKAAVGGRDPVIDSDDEY